MLARIAHRLRSFVAEDATHPLTPEQRVARQKWQAVWNLPLIVAATLPLFVTSPRLVLVDVVVGVGSWVVFVIDLYVQRRIDPRYLHRTIGRFDLAVVVVTFPFYLIPGISGGTALLLFARLGRVVRVLMATAGLRRFAARLGKVAVVAGVVVIVCSLGAYGAEHKVNPLFGSVGDAFWWGVVTLTTVGYGDIYPITRAGRFAGVAIMFTGVAVLGVLAGSLASLFRLDPPTAEEAPAAEAPAPAATDAIEVPTLHAELSALRADLHALEQRLGAATERALRENAR